MKIYSHRDIAKLLAEAGVKAVEKLWYVDDGDCPVCDRAMISEWCEYTDGTRRRRVYVGCNCVVR